MKYLPSDAKILENPCEGCADKQKYCDANCGSHNRYVGQQSILNQCKEVVLEMFKKWAHEKHDRLTDLTIIEWCKLFEQFIKEKERGRK
jgi:hypothetical protein